MPKFLSATDITTLPPISCVRVHVEDPGELTRRQLSALVTVFEWIASL